MTVKTSGHALLQELPAVVGREGWSNEDICFFGEDVDTGEGKQLSEVYRVHLDDFSRRACYRNGTPFLVLLPPALDDQFLLENLVDFGNRNRDVMFLTEEVLDLLSTTVPFSIPKHPDPALEDGINLSPFPLSFLGVGVGIQIWEESRGTNALDPEADSVAVHLQSLCDIFFHHTCLVQLPGKRNLGDIVHDHIFYWSCRIFMEN